MLKRFLLMVLLGIIPMHGNPHENPFFFAGASKMENTESLRLSISARNINVFF